MTEENTITFGRREYCKSLVVASAFVGAGIGTASAESTTSVGEGGYYEEAPEGAETHDYSVHTSQRFGDRPIPTNDWYSTIPLEGITGEEINITAHPLIFNSLNEGLAVGHPTEWDTNWDPEFDVGHAAMSDTKDLTISHADAGSYSDVALDDHGDWSVRALWGEGSGSALRTTFAQGSPFVFCETEDDGGIEISLESSADVWTEDSNVLGFTVDDRDWGLYAPSGSEWEGVDSLSDGESSGSVTVDAEYCSVAILPSSDFLEPYEEYAYNVLRDTLFEWEYDQSNAEVRMEFHFDVEQLSDSSTSGTVMAMFPHQWRYSDESTLGPTYASPRGDMEITTGSSITVVDDWNGMVPFLPDEGDYDRNELESELEDVKAEVDGDVAQPTYRFGKEVGGRLAKTAAVADQVGMTEKRDALLETVRGGLEEWFTPSAAGTFYYDDSVGVLQGWPGSHGSVEELSDHHFHFGYYVWAAARVARHDPDWADTAEWGGMVEELIRDYGNPDRDDEKYPFNRNFSVYEGHSWAHGSGKFASGNNQESSSEAMMAYAALIEWGEITENETIRDFGIALYTMHARAIEEYWFDRHEETYPERWEGQFAGIVWGISGAHSTWWTADSEAVYGINMLPLSGFSMYLGRYDDLTDRAFERIDDLKDGSFDYWPDILWMYRAFSDPQDAIDRFESGGYEPEDGQEPAHTRYWIYNLAAMGSPDPSVTADTPFYQVFSDGETRTYVAYNATDSEITVEFSDGTQLAVSAHSMATSTGQHSDDDDDDDDDNDEEPSTPEHVKQIAELGDGTDSDIVELSDVQAAIGRWSENEPLPGESDPLRLQELQDAIDYWAKNKSVHQ
ncbi:MAG: glycosyl hydrolase [archaeon]